MPAVGWIFVGLVIGWVLPLPLLVLGFAGLYLVYEPTSALHWSALGAFIGFTLEFVFWRCPYELMEAIRPSKYHRVALGELRNHVTELFRRGGDNSQMVIAAEGTDKSIRVGKIIGQRGRILMRVILRDVGLNAEDKSSLIELLERNNLSYTFGTGRLRLNPYPAVIDGGTSVQTAMSAIHTILREFHHLDEAATYCVWVKGRMNWGDVVIDTTDHATWSEIFAIHREVRCGRPYKRSHRRSMKERQERVPLFGDWVVAKIGSAVLALRRLLRRRGGDT